MKCVIAGSRTILDYELVEEAFTKCPFSGKIDEIVSGTAKGVDQLGERVAYSKEIKVSRFPANWKKFGKAAGHIRNKEMAEYADAAIILWDGSSRGAKNMYDHMEKMGKLCCIYLVKDGKLVKNNFHKIKLDEDLFRI